MRNRWLALVLWAACAVFVVAQTAPAVVVLKGFDPVELVNGREVKGLATFSVTRGRYQYLFANVANKRAFEKAPAVYQIQMGGGCGRMGSLSGVGNPDRFYVFDRKIYIFASEQCLAGFKAAPEKHLEYPDQPPTGTAAERRRAQTLIQLALKGFGGAARVDALKTYQAKIKLGYKVGDKVDEYWQTQSIAFPGRYRNEYDWRTSISADVLRPDSALSVDKNGAYEREAPVREALERSFYRLPLVLLKARRQPGFLAYAAGQGKVGDAEIEWLKIGFKGATTTLGVDVQTGRVLQVTYRDRKGAFGELVKTYSDFRAVDGVMLPFVETETFNGKPITEPLFQVETITLNAKLDEAWFRQEE